MGLFVIHQSKMLSRSCWKKSCVTVASQSKSRTIFVDKPGSDTFRPYVLILVGLLLGVGLVLSNSTIHLWGSAERQEVSNRFACQNHLRMIRESLLQYYLDHGRYPSVLSDAGVDMRMMTCPITKMAYSYSLRGAHFDVRDSMHHPGVGKRVPIEIVIVTDTSEAYSFPVRQ